MMNTSSAPLVNAVRLFAYQHRECLSSVLLDEDTIEVLATVSRGDYANMYKAASPLLDKVPRHLHEKLFETMSDALVTPKPVFVHDGTTESSIRCISWAFEEVKKCIADATATSAASPLKEKTAPSINDSPVSRSESTPVTNRSPSTSNNKQAGEGEGRNPQYKIKHRQKYRTKEQSRRHSKLMTAGHSDLAPLTLVPQSTTSGSSTTMSTPLFDRCGVFHVPNRKFGTSFFALPDGTSPPLNAHAVALFRAGHLPRLELIPVFQEKSTRCKWTVQDTIALKRAVKAHLSSAINRDHPGSDGQSKSIVHPPSVKDMKEITSRWDKHDWIQIVRAANISSFPWNACRARYLKMDAPWASEVQPEGEADQDRVLESSSSLATLEADSPTTQDWTSDEDAVLLEKEEINRILSDPANDGWFGVARHLHSRVGCRRIGDVECRRTPLETLRRWRFLQDEAVRTTPRRPWTPREDDLLRKHVPTQKSWDKIAVILGTLRTPQQCLHRYHKRLQEGRIKGRWGSDEVVRLLDAVKVANNGQGDAIVDSSWVEIAKSVRTRSDVQCREKWIGTLRPGLQRGGWTHQEDCKLKDAIKTAAAQKQSEQQNGGDAGSASSTQGSGAAAAASAPPAPPSPAAAQSASGGHNWKLVASLMNNGRDSLQCQRRASIMWSDEEINRLREALAVQRGAGPDDDVSVQFMIENYSWDQIAWQVGTRSVRQCRSQTRYLYA